MSFRPILIRNVKKLVFKILMLNYCQRGQVKEKKLITEEHENLNNKNNIKENILSEHLQWRLFFIFCTKFYLDNRKQNNWKNCCEHHRDQYRQIITKTHCVLSYPFFTTLPFRLSGMRRWEDLQAAYIWNLWVLLLRNMSISWLYHHDDFLDSLKIFIIPVDVKVIGPNFKFSLFYFKLSGFCE